MAKTPTEVLEAVASHEAPDRGLDFLIDRLARPDEQIMFPGQHMVQINYGVVTRVATIGRLADFEPDDSADLAAIADDIGCPRYTERIEDALTLYPRGPRALVANPRMACAEALRRRFGR